MLQRLGETSEFGFELLDLLGRAGWSVVVTTPFAGLRAPEHGDEVDANTELERAQVLVIVERDGLEYRETGPSVGKVGPRIFQLASRHGLRDAGASPVLTQGDQ